MTRIALVLHGRGSLGSYVAGACSELLLALERNRSAGDVVIDVVTGGAAGSLTAALVARSLVVNRHLVPWIERCWVEALDASHFSNPGSRAATGGRGDSTLDELSRGLITSSAATDDEPLPMFGGALHLGLDGVDFILTGATGPDDGAWDDVRRAAVASSGFPPVIPSVALGPDTGTHAGPLGPSALGQAARLSALADGPDPEGRRLIVAIDPDVRRSASNGVGGASPAIDPRGGAGDARLLDALIARLPEIVDRIDDPGALALGRHLGDLAERAAELESGREGELDDEQLMDLIDASLERIEADDRLAAILARANSRSGRTRLAKLIYVLQAACGGAAVSADSLVMIAPEAPEALACRSLGALGGFLSRPWREADFRAGRRDARDAILSALAEWIDYEPDDDRAYLSGETPAALGPEAEARLRTLVEAEVDRALAEVRVGGLAALFGGWKGALKKHAADRVLSDLRAERS